MFIRLAAFILTAGGGLILLVGLLADVIGRLTIAGNLGVGQDPGFGGQQTMAAIVGAAFLLIGIWLWRRHRPPSDA